MFLGHFGVGFGAKAASRKTSLGTLFLAAQFLDLLWPTLLLVGLERVRITTAVDPLLRLDFTSYPWSHSLAMAAFWSLLLGTIYFVTRRSRRGAVVVGLAVLSHWLLDLPFHVPDLPLAPGATTLVGLGLWRSVPLSVALELAALAAGLVLYLRTTGGRGGWKLWSLVAFLLAVYAASLLGPPPPDPRAVAWGGQAQWLLVAWGYWIDREPRGQR